jgi:hypothetical protein
LDRIYEEVRNANRRYDVIDHALDISFERRIAWDHDDLVA